MNEELTNEVLEAMKKCGLDCARCGSEFCNRYDWQDIVQTLATALLEERAKPKDDVWKYATMQTDRVVLNYYEGDKFCAAETFTRELPKTRARQIAEKEGHGLAEKYGWHSAAEELVTNRIEAALNKYAEELGEKK